jgi:hypothetical protein
VRRHRHRLRPSGLWAVKELTEGGLKVVPFEAGRNLDIARDVLPTQRWVEPGCGGVKSAIRGRQVQLRCASSGA